MKPLKTLNQTSKTIYPPLGLLTLSFMLFLLVAGLLTAAANHTLSSCHVTFLQNLQVCTKPRVRAVPPERRRVLRLPNPIVRSFRCLWWSGWWRSCPSANEPPFQWVVVNTGGGGRRPDGRLCGNSLTGRRRGLGSRRSFRRTGSGKRCGRQRRRR